MQFDKIKFTKNNNNSLAHDLVSKYYMSNYHIDIYIISYGFIFIFMHIHMLSRFICINYNITRPN